SNGNAKKDRARSRSRPSALPRPQRQERSRRMSIRAAIGVAGIVLSLLTGHHAADAAVSVTIDPRNPVAVRASQTRQFTATVSGATDVSVKWALTPPPGVSLAGVGSITTSGLYTAPAQPLPGFSSLTVTVTSVAQPTASASNTITVLNPLPTIGSVSPSSLPLGAFTLFVYGSRFVPGAQIRWNGAPPTPSLVSASHLM